MLSKKYFILIISIVFVIFLFGYSKSQNSNITETQEMKLTLLEEKKSTEQLDELGVSKKDVLEKRIIYSDFREFKNIDELTNKATNIIMGKITNSTIEKIDIVGKMDKTIANDPKLNPGGDNSPEFQGFVVFEVQILSSYKGNMNITDTIKVAQRGGVVDGIQFVDMDTNFLKVGEEYLMYLSVYENNMPAVLLNPIQGAYKHENGNFKNFHESNNLVVNKKYLKQKK